jgi:hypothetical protein
MAIKCPICGHDVKPTAVFCEKCGVEISSIQDPSISQPPAPPSQEKDSYHLFCKNPDCKKHDVEVVVKHTSTHKYCGACGWLLEERGAEPQHQNYQLEPPPSPAAEKPPDSRKKSRGYLVMPDGSEREITTNQMPIGRADLSKNNPRSDIEAVSRVHITVWREDWKEREIYLVQDGETKVQEKPSTNKTWLRSDGQQKEEITGKGRLELKDGDQIIIADTVTLSFTLKQ